MKFIHSFYGKLSIVFLLLLLTMGILQVFITIESSKDYYDEADQRLNINLAKDMSREIEPFLTDSIDLANVGHSIHYMMVNNPKIEIYLLDDRGTILAFFAEPHKKIKGNKVDVKQIKQFLSSPSSLPAYGDDPRNPGTQKTFSAAEVNLGKNKKGFLYIIIGSEQYESAADTLRNDYILKSLAKGMLLALLFTGIIGLILFFFLTRRLKKMTEVVKKFEKGNYDIRTEYKAEDEIGQLALSFDKMADTIVVNMDQLKRNDDLRRELVANVSHDLRSPLASIQGYVETMSMKNDELDTEGRKKYTDIIIRNTGMLSNLVNQLFELSKLDANQVKPKPEPFYINELLQDITLKFKPAADKACVEIQLNIPPKTLQVYGDIALIERAVSNLIENAIRFTPEKGQIIITLNQWKDKVDIYISDTGSGISEEDLPYVFERFYRNEKKRSSDGGIGLGLSIAKKILELHGSQITVVSRRNKGTTFSFELKTI